MNPPFAPVFLLLACASLAPAQAVVGPLPAGGAGGLSGLSRVYVSAPPHLRHEAARVAETLRRREPRLTPVGSRADAEVWLEFTVERVSLSERKVTPPPPGESGRGENNLVYGGQEYALRGRVYVLDEAGRPRLLRTFRRAGGSYAVAGRFADDFLQAYRKANPAAPRRGAAPGG